MIPIRDDIRPLRTPIVNYALILACLLVFLAQLGAEGGDGTLVEQFGMIPARVVHPDQPVTLQYEELVPVRGGYRVVERRRLAEEPPIPAWLTVLTCIFLHGGWLPLADVLAYDPAANSWMARAPLPFPLVDAGAAVLGGELYIVGGIAPGGVTSRVFVAIGTVTSGPMPNTRCFTGSPGDTGDRGDTRHSSAVSFHWA